MAFLKIVVKDENGKPVSINLIALDKIVSIKVNKSLRGIVLTINAEDSPPVHVNVGDMDIEIAEKLAEGISILRDNCTGSKIFDLDIMLKKITPNERNYS